MKHKQAILLPSKTKTHTTAALYGEYASDVIGYGSLETFRGDFVAAEGNPVAAQKATHYNLVASKSLVFKQMSNNMVTIQHQDIALFYSFSST